MRKLLATKIQRMCFHDGPGIRTTVFLKGCTIHCPWCANPENIGMHGEYGYDAGRCEGRHGNCRYDTACEILSGKKPERADCPLGAKLLYGQSYTTDGLLLELLKDEAYWDKDGGVTFSGGEPLLQSESLLPVMEALKKKGVSIAVESAMFLPEGLAEETGRYIDFYYIDVKLLEEGACRRVLGGSLADYFRNVEYLARHGKNIHFRLPCVRGYTFTPENRRRVLAFLKEYRQYPVEIFSVHNLAEKKYRSLGLPYVQFDKSSEKELEGYRRELEDLGVRAEIIRL